MTLDQAANFLVGCILAGLGFGVIGVVLVFLNNLFHKFWKPIELGIWALPIHYRENEEPRIEPKIENEKGVSNEHGTRQNKA